MKVRGEKPRIRMSKDSRVALKLKATENPVFDFRNGDCLTGRCR